MYLICIKVAQLIYMIRWCKRTWKEDGFRVWDDKKKWKIVGRLPVRLDKQTQA